MITEHGEPSSSHAQGAEVKRGLQGHVLLGGVRHLKIGSVRTTALLPRPEKPGAVQESASCGQDNGAVHGSPPSVCFANCSAPRLKPQPTMLNALPIMIKSSGTLALPPSLGLSPTLKFQVVFMVTWLDQKPDHASAVLHGTSPLFERDTSDIRTGTPGDTASRPTG